MSSLNPQQQTAANAAGSVSITAGAGTGKTHVLSERYFHLLASNSWSPLSIVAVTFTEKAADELRSRIRKTVAENNAEADIIAEVDAAQISTIHALAARICRDFYDIAGIPADFRVMDQNASTLWTLGKIEEAIGETCVDEAVSLGYSFLLEALSKLLGDPYTASKAFSACDEVTWRRRIKEHAAAECERFALRLASSEVARRLTELRGAEGDRRESLRISVLEAIEAIRAGDPAAADILCEINLRGGGRGNWPEGAFDEAKGCLETLRNEAREFAVQRDAKYSPADAELLAKICELRNAFEKAHRYLTVSKAEEKYLDYNDLELNALKILRHADAARHYRERWKAFLIDEFQDTSPVQAELIGLLTAGGANLTVVGDEKQAIYGFRGADVEVFGRFREEICRKGGEEVVLDETYRSNSSLVEQMNRIFEPLLGELHQPLRSGREYPGQASAPFISLSVVAEPAESKQSKQYAEARDLARIIRSLKEERVQVYDKAIRAYRAFEYRDAAVLSRVWSPLEVFGDALAEAGVPAVNAGGGSLLNTREFKDACSLITFLADQTDDLALACVLRSPFFAVSDRSLYRFVRTLERNASWWPQLRAAVGLDAHLGEARDLLARLLRERVHQTPEDLLRLASKETGYAAVVANLPHGSRREADWFGTLQFVRELQQTGWEDLFSVARYLRIAVNAELDVTRPAVESGDAVSLMTIHAAKGLEWPVVFIPDLSRKFQNDNDVVVLDPEIGAAFAWESEFGEAVEPTIYQMIKCRRKAREEAERSRLLYVALTRAGDLIRLSAAEEKGGSLDKLVHGLAAAGIHPGHIACEAGEMLPPAPGEPAPFAAIAADTDPVTIPTESVTATGLSVYAECPQRYKFQFVLGHPGLSEYSTGAATIGSLAHLALEMDIDSVEALGAAGGCSDAALLKTALDQARNYRENAAFESVRSQPVQKELGISEAIAGVAVYGKADVVGEEFVLDYKTDAVAEPDKHGLQLWAYARALKKPKAYIAYLRHGVLHEITPADLAELDATGYELLDRLRRCDFDATPSAAACERCSYSMLCSSKYEGS